MTDVAPPPQETSAPPHEAAPPTPPENPAPSEDAPSDGRQSQPSAYAALQRAEQSTIGRQRKAATDALGLEKNATPEEIESAIEALKKSRSTEPQVELPKEVVAEQNRLAQLAWQAAERDFGKDFVMQAQNLEDVFFNIESPYDRVSALNELARSVAASEAPPPQAEEPPAQEAAPAQQQQERPGVDAEIGKPGWTVQPDEDDKPGSGETRKFFERIFPR